MKRYGNIRFTRRVVVALCMLIVAVSVLMPAFTVRADTKYSFSIGYGYCDDDGSYHLEAGFVNHMVYTSSPVYCFIEKPFRSTGYNLVMYCSGNQLSAFPSFCNAKYDSERDITYFDHFLVDDNMLDGRPISYYFTPGFCKKNGKTFYYLQGGKPIAPTYVHVVQSSSDSWYNTLDTITGSLDSGFLYGKEPDTSVTNDSIGYLQDIKLNLSYITPIKGNTIFETTNYQIYTDMIYNLKWDSKTTTSNYDLSSSYVQLYARAEYKNERNNVSLSDFIELGNSEKASKGKLKFSFMELFEKSNNCKSAYLSDYPLASADYKNGKLQACSVTSNIKYKFYIRVYKGTDKGPWLCVSEKGSHHSNEFVNSGDKVPFNVSSGDLDSDGNYKPDGNINENGNGITGTGTDKDDADADTNANDKIQSKHDSSNNTFDKLEEFVQGIGDVPKMIADIFSFLPSWCLDVVGIGFSLLMILIVVKFIRG